MLYLRKLFLDDCCCNYTFVYDIFRSTITFQGTFFLFSTVTIFFACFQYWSAFCCMTWWWSPHWAHVTWWWGPLFLYAQCGLHHQVVPGNSNILKRCMLCLYEKYEILNYPSREELLNKRSELVSKCQHVNKFILSNYKSND